MKIIIIVSLGKKKTNILALVTVILMGPNLSSEPVLSPVGGRALHEKGV